MKHKIKGSIIAIIGYILSPLSWWNDLIINIPLAYAFAFPFGLISKKIFLPMMVLGYWLTNITGFMLMHYGIKDVVAGKNKSPNIKHDFIKNFAISTIYTAVVILLAKAGWLKFPLEYFK